jgi:hypothetical protein
LTASVELARMSAFGTKRTVLVALSDVRYWG